MVFPFVSQTVLAFGVLSADADWIRRLVVFVNQSCKFYMIACQITDDEDTISYSTAAVILANYLRELQILKFDACTHIVLGRRDRSKQVPLWGPKSRHGCVDVSVIFRPNSKWTGCNVQFIRCHPSEESDGCLISALVSQMELMSVYLTNHSRHFIIVIDAMK